MPGGVRMHGIPQGRTKDREDRISNKLLGHF